MKTKWGSCFRSNRIAAGALCLVMLCGEALRVNAAVIRVSAYQTNNVPDGGSWATAFPIVQQAINAAGDGDAVWVAAGTFQENITLKAGVALYGGFAGFESDLIQRNWKTNLTILDGRQSNSVVIVAVGAANSTRIDGFMIRNGRASNGGGILCSNASAVIANNFIADNFATNGGSGVRCYGGSPTLASNIIRQNTGYYSGCVDCTESAAKIQNNRIEGNRVSLPGVGVGAISCSGNPAPRIVNNLILGNRSLSFGSTPGSGGIFIAENCAAQVVNNTLLWNQGASPGAGIYCSTPSAPGLVTNFPSIVNNIIAFGSSGVVGIPGMEFKNNCVFNLAANFSGFRDPTGTNGNISADPRLNSTNLVPDFHLLATSPCRDAGDNSAIQPGGTDLDGAPRIANATVDIGADEFENQTPPFPPVIVRVSTAGDDANDGSSWLTAKRTIQAAIDAATREGGEVWIQSGTYQELLTLKLFVALYGGFAGNELELEQRNWRTNVTIIDGNQSGSAITATNLMQWGAIDGLVIRNGSAINGAGINCSQSQPLICHNTITNNVAISSGGGIYYAGSGTISNNVISFNRATGGGGICASAPGVQITDNRFEGNVAAANPASHVAGGGGGIQIGGATVRNNFFLNNLASNGLAGGGINCNILTAGPLVVVNNTLIGNRSSAGGGGIDTMLFASDTVMANNIIAFGGWGIDMPPSITEFTNNCVFGNTVNYPWTDFTGMYGNISLNPLFAATNDYHLGPNSPCINAGKNANTTDRFDLDGNPRISGGTVDIGAHEFQMPASVISYAWLQKYGLPTDGSADYADVDGDRANNWQEWQEGTNPTNNQSFPFPVMTAQPSSLSQVQGLSATFTTAVKNVLPIHYQWQLDGADIPGANENTYVITNVQPWHVGTYRVVVSNEFGVVESSNAVLEIGQIAGWEFTRSDPTRVPPGATNVIAIAAGFDASLWLNTNGTISGSGFNYAGELAILSDPHRFISLAAGYANVLAITTEGTVVAYGYQNQAAVPVGLNNPLAVALGFSHSLAVTTDGKVIAWGDNSGGQINVPPGLSNVVAIAAGSQHSLALKADGTVVGWGTNDLGQASPPSGLTNVVAIAAGSWHSVALKADGTVVVWGNAIVHLTEELSRIVSISAGATHCLALREDGTVTAWGSNNAGQLDVPSGLTNVTAIACGAFHNLALVDGGPSPRDARAFKLTVTADGFSLSLPTQRGHVYRLEYKDTLQDNWKDLPLVAGNGTERTLTDPHPSTTQRFYRVRRW